MPVQTRETPREPWPKPQPSRGSLSRSSSGRGPNFDRASPLAEASGCAIRRSLSPFPRSLQAFRPTSRQSARRSRRIPARSGDRPLPPVSLWLRVEPSVRFPFLPVQPSVRFPVLPASAFRSVSRPSSLTFPTVSRRSGPSSGFPFDVTGKVDHHRIFHKPET